MRTISNPPNPFDSHHRELLEPAPVAKLMVYEDETRKILSRNDSPDLPFRWSVNPYRGCFHASADRHHSLQRVVHTKGAKNVSVTSANLVTARAVIAVVSNRKEDLFSIRAEPAWSRVAEERCSVVRLEEPSGMVAH